MLLTLQILRKGDIKNDKIEKCLNLIFDYKSELVKINSILCNIASKISKLKKITKCFNLPYKFIKFCIHFTLLKLSSSQKPENVKHFKAFFFSF